VKRLSEWSSDGSRRYRLGRFWADAGPVAAVIGLNPSRADSDHDDPTNRRLIELMQSAGYRGYWLLNLIPFSTPYPKQLQSRGQRLSKRNRDVLLSTLSVSDAVVLAWGAGGLQCAYRHEIVAMVDDPLCFGLTQSGEPRHPLYLPRGTPLVPYHTARRWVLEQMV
jgi:Uncharacterized protein conserved in bacteria